MTLIENLLHRWRERRDARRLEGETLLVELDGVRRAHSEAERHDWLEMRVVVWESARRR